ncbi:MAG: hypothetical protein ACE5HA_08890, partial [Anaerolineae bacterium]
MDPRMVAREWFLDKPGDNKYDIEVHVQRSFWHNGFGEAFFRCVKADPPYKCVGFWRGQAIEFEWAPRQWLTLSMQEYDAGVVDGFSGVMHLEPSLRYSVVEPSNGHNPDEGEPAEAEAAAQERFVVEWRVRDVEQRLNELAEQAG